MGIYYEFTCDDCGYATEASGRPDAGMLVRTTPMTCARCRALVDVVEGPSGEGFELLPELEKRRGRCPTCLGRELSAWSDPGPCPRCSGELRRGEATLLWD